MDTLFLHGLKAETLIGVYDWERQQRQTLLLDVDIGTDARPAGHSDNIDDTIHYGDVAEALRHNLAQQQFLLLEALAEHVAQFLLDDFGAMLFSTRKAVMPLAPVCKSVLAYTTNTSASPPLVIHIFEPFNKK